MDRAMKRRSLLRKMLTHFVVCIAVLLLLATPVFYFLTRHYYAEDMIDIVEAVGQGHPIPALDLEEDILHGVMIQYGVIVAVLSVAVALTVRFLSRRLWHPFYETLRRAEGFRLEDGTLPDLPPSDVAEFTRLNNTLSTLMANGLASYRTQKEFTENASHELQTPIAVMRSTLDLMLQQPGLTPRLAGHRQGKPQRHAQGNRHANRPMPAKPTRRRRPGKAAKRIFENMQPKSAARPANLTQRRGGNAKPAVPQPKTGCFAGQNAPF